MPTHVHSWRHRRVWLQPSLCAHDIGACADDEARALFIGRATSGLPVVGRAVAAADVPGWRPVGLALPRSAGSRPRLSCCVPVQAVLRVEEPLSLEAALLALPLSMRDTGARLVHAAQGMGLPLFVYGSVFWQQADGGAYLHERSDLDLLARPRDETHWRRWLACLDAAQTRTSLRIDGEVELPCGGSVSWRELAGQSEQVLVKTDQGPQLRPRVALWTTAAAQPLAC